MRRASIAERDLARRTWRVGWTLGAVTAATVALVWLDSRETLGTGPWLVVLVLVFVAACGLALSWRAVVPGGLIVLVSGATLVPIVSLAAEGDRRLALAMVSAPFVVSGFLIVASAFLVRARR